MLFVYRLPYDVEYQAENTHLPRKEMYRCTTDILF